MSRPLKAGYGVAEIGLVSMEVMLQVYLLKLYIEAGLSPFWASTALSVAVIWDAVSDPLMGVVSDRTPLKTARGKRLLYIGIGAPLCAVSFIFLFSPNPGASELAMGLHLLGWFLLLNTAMTLVIVPYLSLINDLSRDSDERSEFFGWRLGFSGLGLIVGLLIPVIVARTAGQSIDDLDTAGILQNRSDAANWTGALVMISVGLALTAVWKAAGRSDNLEASRGATPFFEVLKVSLRSKAFLLVVGAFVFISLGRAVNASLALIYYEETLRFTDTEVALALIGLSLTVMAATPLWVWLGKQGSRRGYCLLGSLGLTLLTAVAYPILPAEALAPVIVVVILGGVTASSVVLLESLFSDVVDSDGSDNDMSLTGSYYGLWRLATKLARAGGLAVAGLFLTVVGYEKGGVAQADGVYRAVAWAFGPGVAVFFALGSLLLWWELKRAKESE